MSTTIEWTDETWNPLRGCSRISPGCQNCYAERMAARFSGPGMPYEGLARMTEHGPRWTGEIRLLPDELHKPLSWRKPRKVFVKMSDLFHADVPDEFIAAVFAVMAMTPQHTYQILTKRADRMAEWFAKVESDPGDILGEAAWHQQVVDDEGACAITNYINGWSRWRDMPEDGNPLNGTVRRWPLPNVWIGVSVENQEYADKRIPDLLQCPAAVRFLSCEPLLGQVDLSPWLWSAEPVPATLFGHPVSTSAKELADLLKIEHLHWVIAGAESGPGARTMNEDWVRSLRDQCSSAGVAFFYKQRLDGRGYKQPLPELDGRKWADMPLVGRITT